MKPRSLYSKYQCDDKLKIYSETPLNNSQYYKMIENAKPRYMNDYYNTPRYYQRKDEKTFNNLLSTYYNDYQKLKNKYNFIEDESNEEENLEEEYNMNYNEDEYQTKRKNLNLLFLSNETSDLDGINFELTDKIINNLYNGKNDSLLKNTQTKDDYILRLNFIKKDPSSNTFMRKDNSNPEEKSIMEEDEIIVEGEDKNTKLKKDNNDDNISIDNLNNEENESFYLEDDNQVENNDENYLILKFNNTNIKECPRVKDIINYNYDQAYDPPLYEIPNGDGEVKNLDDIMYADEEEKDNENNDNENSYNNFENNKNDGGGDNEINEEEDENYLKLINNNNKDNLFLLDNIISNDFNEEYIIPSYKNPKYIQQKINKEQQKQKKNNEKEEYNNEEVDLKGKDNNSEDNNKMLNDILKEKEKPEVNDIININNKVVYNPPENSPKNENEENEDDKNKNERYSLYNDYSVPNYKSINQDKKDEEKNEDINNDLKEDFIDYDKYKGSNDYHTVNEMVLKEYQEEKKKYNNYKNKEENKDDNNNQITEKKDDKVQRLKESINDDDDKIVVDELDDDIEDNEEKYGFD